MEIILNPRTDIGLVFKEKRGLFIKSLLICLLGLVPVNFFVLSNYEATFFVKPMELANTGQRFDAVELYKTDLFFQEVAEQLGLSKKDCKKLKRKITVSQKPWRNLLVIQSKGKDPEEAKRLAQSAADLILKKQLETALSFKNTYRAEIDGSKKLIDELEKQAKDIQSRIALASSNKSAAGQRYLVSTYVNNLYLVESKKNELKINIVRVERAMAIDIKEPIKIEMESEITEYSPISILFFILLSVAVSVFLSTVIVLLRT